MSPGLPVNAHVHTRLLHRIILSKNCLFVKRTKTCLRMLKCGLQQSPFWCRHVDNKHMCEWMNEWTCLFSFDNGYNRSNWWHLLVISEDLICKLAMENLVVWFQTWWNLLFLKWLSSQKRHLEFWREKQWTSWVVKILQKYTICLLLSSMDIHQSLGHLLVSVNKRVSWKIAEKYDRLTWRTPPT